MAQDASGAKTFSAFLAQELRLPSILRTGVALTPGVVTFIVTRDPIYLKLCVLTVSMWAGVVRVSQSYWLLIGHALLLMGAVTLLYVALPSPLLFTLVCALFAFARVYVAQHGAHLRTLGDFTFLPALFVAGEFYAIDKGGPGSQHALGRMFEHMPVSVLSVMFALLLWQTFEAWRPAHRHTLSAYSAAAHSALAFVGRRHDITIGRTPPTPANYDPFTVARLHFIAMIATGGLNYLFSIPHPQWSILAAAAVVTGEPHSMRLMVKNQFIGVLIGAPLAFLLTRFVTLSDAVYAALVVTMAINEITFSRVLVTCVTRAFLSVFLIEALRRGAPMGAERIECILFGVAAGALVSSVAPPLFELFEKRARTPATQLDGASA